MPLLLQASVLGVLMAIPVHLAIADGVAQPIRSSVEAFNEINLSGIDESDFSNPIQTQKSDTDSIGPVVATTEIDSSQGYYGAVVGSSAEFHDSDHGTFRSSMSYLGMVGDGPILAQSFRHSLDGIFEYDFTIPSDGSLNINGSFYNSGPSVFSYFAFVQIFSEDEIGDGFDISYFDTPIYDFSFSGQDFDMDIPLNAPSGSYRIMMRISHNGLTVLNAPLNDGWIQASFAVDAQSDCRADLNNDGETNFFDISIFLNAYTSRDLLADFNNDGRTDFFDLSSFLIEIAIGCD